MLVACACAASNGAFDNIKRDIENIRQDIYVKLDNLVERVGSLEKEAQALRHGEQLLSVSQAKLRKDQDELRDKQRLLEENAAKVQIVYHEQQEDLRQRSGTLTQYSAAFHLHAGMFDEDKYGEMLKQVKELTGLPSSRLIRGEDTEGRTYPLVLLVVVMHSRLMTAMYPSEIARCRNLVATGGQLVLVVLHSSYEDTPKEAPRGVDQMVVLPFKSKGKLEPHVLHKSVDVYKKGVSELSRIMTARVPEPPKFGMPCMFPFLKQYPVLGQYVPGCKDEL